MGGAATVEKGLDALINALRDQDKHVCNKAVDRCGRFREESEMVAVMNTLISALRDPDKIVRCLACDVLAFMGEKVATREVINGLIDALQDLNRAACTKEHFRFDFMDEETATREDISALLGALWGADIVARSVACHALGWMGERAATKVVYDNLMTVVNLHREDKRLRIAAADALAKIGGWSEMKDVILPFSRRLHHRIVVDCDEACYEVSLMAGKADWGRVLTLLVEVHENGKFLLQESLLGRVLTMAVGSYEAMLTLSPEMVVKLCELCRAAHDMEWSEIPSDHFVKVFGESEEKSWLDLVKYAALLHGVAITVMDDKILIYDKKQVIATEKFERELLNTFMNAMKAENNTR
ncbi:unnamed protein product [Rotaria magnacalcarata]|uniref:Uncharacterized protein n=1 Tax=Rotaria magnacalcarata TaxID=392030 RepID=A0A820R147_9BILA|nr:unnamed protein product [Rotaria magnacalcarata]CAF4428712.1 unnamed protein product [Rotaria magnacalcarata]